MNTKSLAIVALVSCIMGSGLMAQNDPFEPNNNQASSTPMIYNVGPKSRFFGLAWNIGTTHMAEQPAVTGPGDSDWFIIGDVTTNTSWPAWPTAASQMRVHLVQTSQIGHRLDFEIVDAGGTVLVGPSQAGYTPMSTVGQGPPHPYDGATAQISIPSPGSTSTMFVRVYNSSASVPAGTNADFSLSVEFSNFDVEEGSFGNNFPADLPNPQVSNHGNGTPSGTGAGNAKNLLNQHWAGYDYYMVELTETGKITVDLDNFQGLPTTTTNYDLFWVDENGTTIPPEIANTPLPGASDTMSQGWGNGLFVVTTPSTSEQIVTPNLPAGFYYFHVMVIDTSSGGLTTPFYENGSYDISFQVDNVADVDEAGGSNNTAATATNIAGTTQNGLLAFDPTGNETDWFKFDLANGDNLALTLTITQPTTDWLEMRLYQPDSGSGPGLAPELIDETIVDNRDPQGLKGTTAGTEYVGTWGSVGSAGSTGLPAGTYYLQVRAGNVGVPVVNGQYSIALNKSSTRDIGSEDTREPNDGFIEASNGGNLANVLTGGLTTDLKLKDGWDVYKTWATRNDTLEVTLLYDADATTDLDLILTDINSNNVIFDGTNNALDFTNENAAGSKVIISANPGDWYRNQNPAQNPPGAGYVYIWVQRFASYGQEFSLNINLNGANPLPSLENTGITATPASITPTNASVVSVNISNTHTTNAISLDSLALKLTHPSGADVTSEYTITMTAPAGGLPASIAASSSLTVTFNVLANAGATNGNLVISVSGMDSTSQPVLAGPNGALTLTGGAAAAANLTYQLVAFSGSLSPGGGATLTATVANLGTLGGDYGDNGSLTIVMMQGTTDVTANFTLLSSPTLPTLIPVGGSAQLQWSYSIDETIELGQTTVTISGGGNDNPTAPGVGNFEIGLPAFFGAGSRGNSCTTTSTSGAPWALVGVLALLGAVFLRRRRLVTS